MMYSAFPRFWPMMGVSVFAWLLPLVILDLILKGIALWRAARNNQSYWFVALLIFNTVGILPLVYLAFFQKTQTSKKK
ncbi:DUF5652 family protein [Patescibacteria group bacterium]|nr:DUF5652 family protein [Patescibacteria group bacterium]